MGNRVDQNSSPGGCRHRRTLGSGLLIHISVIEPSSHSRYSDLTICNIFPSSTLFFPLLPTMIFFSLVSSFEPLRLTKTYYISTASTFIGPTYRFPGILINPWIMILFWYFINMLRMILVPTIIWLRSSKVLWLTASCTVLARDSCLPAFFFSPQFYIKSILEHLLATFFMYRPCVLYFFELLASLCLPVLICARLSVRPPCTGSFFLSQFF